MKAEISTFVVDDEPVARRRVERLLRAVPDVRVTGTFGSAAEAVRAAGATVPDLLILDIRMPELDGFQLLNALAQRGLHPYVIFVTAYADRALDGFSSGAVDYLLKPFDEERFARSIERAKTLIRSAARSQAARESLLGSRLLLSERGQVTVVPMREIEFVQASARNVKIHAAGRCYIFRQSLRELEARLDPSYFVRVHRSVLVNVEHIAQMTSRLHGDCDLVLSRGTRLTLSRRYRNRLRPYLIQQRLRSDRQSD